ncbi:MAG: serine--tRNA ligase [Fimbriimonadaceae bacterium]
MHDRTFLRANPDLVKKGLAKKNMAGPVDELLRLDEDRRALLGELEAKKAEQNRVSKSIGALIGQGKREEAEKAQAETKTLKEDIQQGEERQREIEAAIEKADLQIPNIPHDSVPEGRDENDNKLVREWGEKLVLAEPKPHWEIAEQHGLLDIARGGKISGSGWMVYTGMGARLQRALFNFMIDHQTQRNGYQEVYPPVVVNRESMIGTGQLPKFEEDMYKIEGEDLFLIPTAEVPVTNLFRDEILDASELTKKLAAFSSCFRKEAGAAGKDTRGLLRMHQFEKVECVKICKPEDSYDELESLTSDAESVLQALGLHYRVMEMCTGELTFSNAKQYDLELWSPGVGKYLEISSCSNFEAFQARRANIRFRRAQGEKPEFAHTLNGSGLACPRLFASILETFQQEDGSVLLPEVLRTYVGTDRISPS